MAEALLPAVAALAGVAIGAIAEAWRSRITFKREKAWELFAEQRRQLEQIYETLSEIGEGYSSAWIEALTVLADPRTVRRDSFAKLPWSRLEMLVHLYVPELKTQLSAIQDLAPEMGFALTNALSRQMASPAETRQLSSKLNEVNEKLMKAIQVMRDAIVARSQMLEDNVRSNVDARLVPHRGK